MELSILYFVNILLYTIVTSQSFMYLIALKDVQLNLQADQYIAIRKLIDKNFRAKYGKLIYGLLITSTLQFVYCSVQPDSLQFFTSLFAWLMLVTDILLAVQGNIPINNTINTWEASNPPANWKAVRTQWFKVYTIRQVVTIAGLISLFVGLIF